MDATNTRIVNIYTESNPNPNSMKFVVNFMLLPEGVSRDYPTIEDTEQAPLANALFSQFDFIQRVFYMSNFVTVTKNDSTDWFEVRNDVAHCVSIDEVNYVPKISVSLSSVSGFKKFVKDMEKSWNSLLKIYSIEQEKVDFRQLFSNSKF